MTTKHMQLLDMANNVNSAKIMNCEICVNRRNGYYAIDRYDWNDGTFVGFAFCGNFIETYHFLQGMLNVIWYKNE